MLSFIYKAKDSAGNVVKAEVQADSEQAAGKLIIAQGLSPLEIKLKPEDGTIGGISGKVKGKDRIIFSRQLSTLINAGLPLVQSLRNVSDQVRSKPLKVITAKIIADVEAGTAFSVALSRHPQAFNDIYVSLISAGEASGTLDKALERIAMQQEKDAEVISKVRGAMAYPAIVIVVMIFVVGFMLVSVLPQVESIYEGLPGAQLPLLTRVLLGISKLITKYWWVVISLIVVGIFFGSRWFSTLGGRRVADKFKMKAWPIGPLFMKMYMARFCRTGNTLVASGIPMVQMLEITSSAVNNVHISDSINSAIEKVKGGKALSDSIERDNNFLPLVPSMLRIGEQSGALEDMMGKAADYYEKEVDNQIKTISTIIEPVLMVILGVVAFVIVAAVLLPIYSLAGQNLTR